MAYLITCAGSKQLPTILNPSRIDKLSYNEPLLEPRMEIINITGVQLNWNYTLPAWKLYSGPRSKIYPPISTENWNKPGTDIKILSALFGWIKHTDLIPYYDLRMSDRKGIHQQQVWRIWNNMNVLNQMIDQNDIDLLSYDYRRAITGSIRSVAILPPVEFTDYGTQKGKWLNKELDNLKC